MALRKYRTKNGIRYAVEVYRDGIRINYQAGFTSKLAALEWEKTAKNSMTPPDALDSLCDVCAAFLLDREKRVNPNAPNVSQCVREVQKKFQAEGMFIPSEPTIRRFVTTYTAECFDEWTLWREGKKAWNDKCAVSLLRDWNLVGVGDIVIADGQTWAVFANSANMWSLPPKDALLRTRGPACRACIPTR